MKACGGWANVDEAALRLGGRGGKAGGSFEAVSSFPICDEHSSTGVLLPSSSSLLMLLLMMMLLLLLPFSSSLFESSFELEVVAGESLSLVLLLLLEVIFSPEIE